MRVIKDPAYDSIRSVVGVILMTIAVAKGGRRGRVLIRSMILRRSRRLCM
jgi:hypothetical protein